MMLIIDSVLITSVLRLKSLLVISNSNDPTCKYQQQDSGDYISNKSMQTIMWVQQPGLPLNAMWQSSVPVSQERAPSSPDFSLTSSQPAVMAIAARPRGHHKLAAALLPAMETPKCLPLLSGAVTPATTVTTTSRLYRYRVPLSPAIRRNQRRLSLA
jgi:hypothetical protein